MTCQSIVRIAGPDDHQEIWRLFLMGHKENSLFDLAPQKVEWFLQRLINPKLIPSQDTGTRGVIGVIGSVGALEGLAIVTIGEFWYSTSKHLEEFIVYVDPEYRQSGHAKAFLKWMQEQANITGLPLLTGIMSNTRTEAKCRLYRRVFPKIGEFFFVTPKGASTQNG